MTSDLTSEQKSAKPYADRSWNDRSETLGSIAENAFERWAGSRITQRFGFEKSPLPREAFLDLAAEVRHAPDWISWDGSETRFYECIGTANNLGFRIRKTKLEAQVFFDRPSSPLYYWIYDSRRNRNAELSWSEVRHRADPDREQQFRDGNKFYFVEVHEDEWTAQ